MPFLMLLVGCDVQLGLFSTTGHTAEALSPHLGYIDIVSGYASKPFNRTNAPQQNLLYILIVLPGLQAQSSGSSTDYDRYVTKLSYDWDTQTGRVSVVVQWDRQEDTVSAANQTFTRGEGNVVVVRQQPDGKLMAQQVASLGPYANHSAVLHHLCQQLTNDQLIASLKLRDGR